jgi:MoaA/NifB/PqqE/SkfB family radical SAM enzyme
MIKQIINNQSSEMLRIEYMPGNLCNHRCNYCFPGSNEGDMPWPDVETVKQNLGHLLSKYRSQGKPKSNIFFVGGEPTLWKDLDNLCQYLKDNFDVVIEMSSNGTRKLDWWERNAKNFDHVGISVHREFANLDHLKEVCDMLYEKGVCINADVLVDPAAYDQCIEIVEYLKTSKYQWPIVAKVVHFDGEHRYTEEQLKYFDNSVKRFPSVSWYESTRRKPPTEIKIVKDSDEVITVNSDSWITRNKLNYFKGWECNLGVDIIKIFPDGRITGNCQQHLYGNNFDFNLYQSDFLEVFDPIIKPVICSKLICGCNEEIRCDKRKVNG